MTEKEKLEYERKLLQKNSSYNLMRGRVGTLASAEYTPSAIEGVNDLSDYLRTHGGYHQQERMIRDKRKTLDRALLYSYQGAIVKKLLDSEEANEPVRALINPDKNKYRFSSSFGYRKDPFTGRSKRHSGVDFALKPGNPIYATGDGVVEAVKFELFGYGTQVLIDHGFGYKTRYAHLKTVGVAEGMKVKRGECIGLSGNSGRSSGPHLHYEVHIGSDVVDPAKYINVKLSK